MSKIHRSFIRTFTWPNFSEITDACLSDPNFRIVHLTDCPSLSDFEKTLFKHDCFKEFLIKSEYLFGVIVHVGTIDEAVLDALAEKILKNIFIDSGKHFLIEFYSDSFHSKPFDNFVKLIFGHREVTTFSHLNSGETGSDDWFNSTPLVNLCMDSGDTAFESFIEDATVGNGNCLMVRTLKLFNKKIRPRVEREILEKLVRTGNHELFRAYLELPMIEANYENSISPNNNTQNILKIDFYGKSLLCIAVEANDLDIVKLLLRLGCDVNQALTDDEIASGDGTITVSDYCGNNFELLKLLLNNDAKFPINFSKHFGTYQNCTGCKKDIYDIALDREKLHAAIASKNENGIAEFRMKYPNLRMAYMFIDEVPYNRSATTTSLREVLQHNDEEDSYLKLYAFLFNNGFRDSYEEIRDLGMPIGWKEKISKLLLDVLKYNQPAHIGYLRNKTKIGTVDDTNRRYGKKVDEIYKFLSEHTGDDVHTILKVLEHSQFLTIVIDFHSIFVNPMCPLLNKETDGITFHTEGYIYVGAGNKEIKQIAATLVHELSHYALHIVFDNACNPYYPQDIDNETKMSEITEEILASITDCDERVITSAFLYDPALWARELIVRVPELITLGERDSFADEKFQKLFDFFNNHVLFVIGGIIAEPEHFRLKREIDQMNNDLGLVERIKRFRDRGIWPNKTQLPEKCESLVSSTPNLLLADIFINLIEPSLISSMSKNGSLGKRCSFILASIDQMESQFQRQILRLWRSTSDVTLILYCTGEDEFVLKESLIDELNEKRNIIVVGSNEKHLKAIAPDSKPVRVQYSWADIDPRNIDILFEKEINFQGNNVALNALIGTDCQVIALEQLVNDRPIEVETFKVLIDNYDKFQYVDRRFTTHENVDNLLSTISIIDRKTLLLSGVSGCGKSIIFSRLQMKIKENHPHVWLSRINLHEWGETFQSIATEDPIDFLANILVRTTDATDRQFQRALFRKLFQNFKVILLFDAYDELSEKYRAEFKNLIEKLSPNVQMWISTRPQFKNALTKYLQENFVSLELGNFSYDDIYDCATKFWQKHVPQLDAGKRTFWVNYIQKSEVESKLKIFARDMISLFTDSIKKFVLGNDFMQPSIVVTLAEYYQEIVKEFIFTKSDHFPIVPYVDVFDIYKMIVAKKYMILYQQKGSEIATETAVDSMFQDAPSYLEHLSLKSKFGPSAVDEFIHVRYTHTDVIDTNQGALEGLLQRSGLISISDNGDREIYFIDDSVRDYFIAVFVMKALRRVTLSESSTVNNTQFDAAMRVLCINVIHPDRLDSLFITFIDEGLKRFWYYLSELVHLKTYIYFTHRTPEITFEFEQPNFLRYLLNEKATFLLTFFLQCFLQQYTKFNSSSRAIVFDIGRADDLLQIAAGTGIFSVVDLFWSENELRKSISSDRVFIAFREAFLYFPDSKIAAVTDNSSFDEAITAFSSPSKFDDRLQTIHKENFQNSTLYNLLAMCRLDQGSSGSDQGISGPDQGVSSFELRLVTVRNRLNRKIDGRKRKFLENYPPASACPSLAQVHMDSLIVPKEFYFEFDKDYVFDVDLFDAYIEMKWIVLERLGYEATTWNDVVANTIFGTVVAKIFCNFDNNVVLKFYHWARSKETLRNSLRDFVAYTIVKYFVGCWVKPGVEEIFRFIKETLGMNLETVYRDRNLVAYFAHITLFLPTCIQFFTKNEFIAFLTCKDAGGESVFEHILSSKSSGLVNILVELRHFGTTNAEIEHIVKNACNITAPYYEDFLQTIDISIIYVLRNRLDLKLNFDLAMECIWDIFSDSLKQAFQSLISKIQLKCTIFHRASFCEDMSVLNGVWHVAKRIPLTDDELRSLLCFTNDRVQRTIIKENDHRFTQESPTIYNTYCEKPAYQFLPFNQKKDTIPEFSVVFNGRPDHSTYIGRLTKRDVDQLCQILYRGTEFVGIKPILYDDADIDLNDENIEIFTGKGMKWLQRNQPTRKFTHNLRELWIDQHGVITVEGKGAKRHDRLNEYALAYDISFVDDLDSERNIYFKYDKPSILNLG